MLGEERADRRAAIIARWIAASSGVHRDIEEFSAHRDPEPPESPMDWQDIKAAMQSFTARRNGQ